MSNVQGVPVTILPGSDAKVLDFGEGIRGTKRLIHAAESLIEKTLQKER